MAVQAGPMRAIGFVSVLMLLVVALAGCQDSKAPPADDPGATTKGRAQQIAAVGNVSLADPINGTVELDERRPILLVADTGPEGPITMFEYIVPANASIPHPFFDDERAVVLEVLPIITQEVDRWQWTIVAIANDTTDIVAQSFFESGTVASGLATYSEPQATMVATDSYFLPLFGLAEGTRLLFLLGGQTDEPSQLGLLFAIRQSYPEGEDSPATTAEALTGGRSAAALDGTVVGSRFQSALFLRLNILAAFGAEVRLGPVEVEDALPVPMLTAATVADTTMRTYFDSPGYSEAFGIYLGAMAQGTWETDVDLHGTTLQARSVIAEHFLVPGAFIAEVTLVGLPVFLAAGEGTSGSDSEFHVVVANANYVEIVLYNQVDLGVSLSELTGNAIAEGASTFLGAAGSVPPFSMLTTPGDLTLRAGDRVMVWPGLEIDWPE